MLLKDQRITPAEFSRKCGLSSGYVHSVRTSLSFDVLQKIAELIPTANLSWLVTGTPPMYSTALSELEKVKRENDQLREKVSMLEKIIALYERNENGTKPEQK